MSSNNLERRISLLSATGTSGLTTDTGPGVVEQSARAGLVGSIMVRNLTGTAPSITAKIQHSPADISVPDATAEWLDLLTFTAITANGAQVQQLVAGQPKYFPRLRALVTRGGTAVTNLDYDVAIS